MSTLDFEWEAFAQKAVSAVVGRNERQMNDGSLAWDALAFLVGDEAVVLTVTADTDEIVVAREAAPGGKRWKSVTAFSDVVGKPLGWCWVGTNHRGYRDSFTLALGFMSEALQPQLTFVAEASCLSAYYVTPCGPPI